MVREREWEMEDKQHSISYLGEGYNKEESPNTKHNMHLNKCTTIKTTVSVSPLQC